MGWTTSRWNNGSYHYGGNVWCISAAQHFEEGTFLKAWFFGLGSGGRFTAVVEKMLRNDTSISITELFRATQKEKWSQTRWLMKFNMWCYDKWQKYVNKKEYKVPHPVLSCSHRLDASLTYQQFLDNAGNNPARSAAAGAAAGAEPLLAAQNVHSCQCGSARVQAMPYDNYVCNVCRLGIPKYSWVPSCRV